MSKWEQRIAYLYSPRSTINKLLYVLVKEAGVIIHNPVCSSYLYIFVLTVCVFQSCVDTWNFVVQMDSWCTLIVFSHYMPAKLYSQVNKKMNLASGLGNHSTYKFETCVKQIYNNLKEGLTIYAL